MRKKTKFHTVYNVVKITVWVKIISLNLVLAGCDKPYTSQHNEQAPPVESKTEVTAGAIVPSEETGLGFGLEIEYPKDFETVTVSRVVDGDTIVVLDDDQNEMTIRLIGIDTPESVHPDQDKNRPEGEVASGFVADLLENYSVVYLEKDVSEFDRYERYLRYVWLNIPEEPLTLDVIKRDMLNALLLNEGYATQMTFKPDTKYKDIFYDIEQSYKKQ